MCALSVLGTNLATAATAPVSNLTGGTSVSDPSAGSTNTSSTMQDLPDSVITTSEKAGAGILTFVCIVGVILAVWWINVD
jgi:mannan endo-1,6-alpha-mannosidase